MGGLISGWAYNRMFFFCLHVGGPITGGGGGYKPQFTVFDT